MALCSTTNGGAAGTKGNPSMSEDNYCWCKMTGPLAGPWVFRGPDNSHAACLAYCAMNCAESIQSNSIIRTAVLSLL
jgi:hypothetical protein